MYIQTGAKTIAQAYANAASVKDKESFAEMWGNLVDELDSELPSGSGFDNGSHFLWDESKPEKLKFSTAFHHMDESGMYNGWSEHVVTVTPSLLFDFDIKVSGRNRNDIKDYIAEQFQDVLSRFIVTRLNEDKLMSYELAEYDYGFNKESSK